MKKLMLVVSLGIGAVLLGAVGCSKQSKPDTETIQGAWKEPAGPGTKGGSSFAFSGTTLEFHGANPQEWYKITFTMNEIANPKRLDGTVTDCPMPQYVGKEVHAIYKIEGDTMTIAGSEPGSPNAPTGFDDRSARKFVIKKE